MQAPDVWSDQNKVSKLGTEIKEIKENISFLDRWSSAIDDAELQRSRNEIFSLI